MGRALPIPAIVANGVLAVAATPYSGNWRNRQADGVAGVESADAFEPDPAAGDELMQL
ncbi:hypothetical protein [Streptomyces sp. NPDC058583]|uniref:hypothetical protein n=1 Tax=unclassified Streptomyces TaxID=2593676 RepID=UPI00364D928D